MSTDAVELHMSCPYRLHVVPGEARISFPRFIFNAKRTRSSRGLLACFVFMDAMVAAGHVPGKACTEVLSELWLICRSASAFVTSCMAPSPRPLSTDS